jgi:hypothetical protein
MSAANYRWGHVKRPSALGPLQTAVPAITSRDRFLVRHAPSRRSPPCPRRPPRRRSRSRMPMDRRRRAGRRRRPADSRCCFGGPRLREGAQLARIIASCRWDPPINEPATRELGTGVRPPPTAGGGNHAGGVQSSRAGSEPPTVTTPSSERRTSWMKDETTQGILTVARGVLADLDAVVLERVLESARDVTAARYAALGVLDEARTGLSQISHARSRRGHPPTDRPSAHGSWGARRTEPQSGAAAAR